MHKAAAGPAQTQSKLERATASVAIHMAQQFTRLTVPLVRENGSLREASWEEALARAAAGFSAALARHGPNAFGLFSCSKATNELNFLAQKFARAVIGCNNIDSCNRT